MSKKKNDYDIMKPIGIFATVGVGIPITFGTLGVGSSISPYGDRAIANVSRQASTSFNLMGTQGLIQGTIPLIGSLEQLKKIKK